jgi:phage shock protein A
MRDYHMMNEEIEKQIVEFRQTAATMGETALEAVSRGDAGLARTAARQAAQYARVVIQLETGERQVEPEEAMSRRSAARSSDESIMA